MGKPPSQRIVYKTKEEFLAAREAFENAGLLVKSNANPETGEYWIEVVIEGEIIKNELAGGK